MPDRQPARNAVVHRNSEGHIYVIEFADGTVKVGQTRQPKDRLRNHTQNAAIHSNPVTRSWVSDLHADHRENEQELIGFCADRWPTHNSSECFMGADFDLLVEHVQGLRYVRLTPEEIAAEKKRCAQIVGGLTRQFDASQELLAVEKAKPTIELIASLANDDNRIVACEAIFEAVKTMYRATPSPWAIGDPTAAERYLVACGASVEAAQRGAAEFELDMRTLYAMALHEEPQRFEDLAHFTADAMSGGA